MNSLRVTVDGRLIGNIKSDKDKDITDSIFYFLKDQCTLNKDVTLRSILKLIKNIDMYPVLSPILTGGLDWLEQIVEDGLLVEEKESDGQLILNWHYSVSDDYFDKGATEFGGRIDCLHKQPYDDELYSLSFTPASVIVNDKIVIDNEINIFDDTRKTFNKQVKLRDSLPETAQEDINLFPTLIKSKKYFTLFDILNGIFWELSFHGGPKEQKESKEEIYRRIDSIKSGETKGIPWEEVKERLKKK